MVTILYNKNLVTFICCSITAFGFDPNSDLTTANTEELTGLFYTDADLMRKQEARNIKHHSCKACGENLFTSEQIITYLTVRRIKGKLDGADFGIIFKGALVASS